MESGSNEASRASSPEPETPPDTPPLPSNAEGADAGYSNEAGQSSGLSDEGGQSSGHFGDGQGQSGHSGEGVSAMGSLSLTGPARKAIRDLPPTSKLCHHHLKQQGMRRLNMHTVACQTDETKEFGPLLPDPGDDPSSSDGTLRLMIQNFRNMGDTVRGPTKRIQNVSWRIMVMPRQHVVQKKGTQKCLGFFLQCCPEAYSDTWSCQASAELRLISQKPGVPHFTRKTNHVYTAKENDWGYSCFMTWADILDDSQGYIKDDRVVLEVTVRADPPRNVVGIEEFRKTIKSWLDLGDYQFSRGKIDLAIEANCQGLKFCKDKDSECRKRLEEQKRGFIEKKLEESIQRIESAQLKEGTDDNDQVSNQTALRMALTSNNHGKNKNNKNKKFQKNSKPRAPTPNNQQKVTTNAVKTESAKVVQQPNVEEEEEEIVKKIGKLDIKGKDRMVLKDQVQKGRKIRVNLKGYYNEELYLGRLRFSWVRRSKVEDDLMTDAACYFSADTEAAASNERDGFVMKYMTEQMRVLNYPDIPDDKKKNIYNMQQLRTFAESAFEVEMQRQTIIRKAAVDAYEFMARSSRTPNKDPAGFEMMDWDVKSLWNEEAVTRRAHIVDREANFLDAKIRLFWDALGGMDKFLESDSSDHESISSSSSDRQNDGCLKPKRTRLDYCSSCMETSTEPRMCDSECQTDELTKQNSPASKDSKNQKNGQKASVPKTVPPPKTAKDPPTKLFFPPPVFPNPEAEKNPNPDGAPVPPLLNSPLFNFSDFGGPEPGQVINALSTVAMNMMNTRRIINKTEEFMGILTRNQCDEGLKNALREISRMAGIAYIENEERPRPPSPVYTDDNDEDFNSLYTKLINNENREMVIMNRQVAKLEEYNKLLANYSFLDQDDVDRLIKGAHAVNLKFIEYERRLKDFQKMNEELEMRHRKTEKQTREELKQAKHHQLQEKERNNQLQKDLKEKNRLLKASDAKVNSLTTERDDISEKYKQLQKDHQALQKKSTEETQKSKREIQQLQDQKRHIQNDLSSREHEFKSQSTSNDEKTKELKKLKEELACEKNKVNQLQQSTSSHQERAKKSEISLLQYQLESGLSLLDRAMVDAKKKKKEMEDAANNRARSSNEVSMCIQSRDEWSNIIDEIKKSIETTRAEHEAQIESIKNGKPMSSLPKISVPKPPPAPQIVKIAPIAPVEPTKTAPGVIGSRPQTSGQQQQQQQQQLQTSPPSSSTSSSGVATSGTTQPPPATASTSAASASTPPNNAQAAPATAVTPPSSTARPISPSSRAPGSPVNKPSTSAIGSSPAKCAPIGTRPNGTVVNGCSAGTESTSSANNPWTWSDSLSSITESFHPSKRMAEDRTSFFANDLLSGLTGINSAWTNNDDSWNATVQNLTQLTTPSSFLNPLNLHPTHLQQQQNQQMQQQQQQQQAAAAATAAALVAQQQQQVQQAQQVQQQQQHHVQHQAHQQAQHQQQQNQQQSQHGGYSQSGWNSYPEMHRQFMYRQQQQYQQHLTTIAKKIGMDLEKTNELVNDFCREHKVHYQNITGDDSVVDKIREFYNKRMHGMRMSAPPGAAPGYLANPLVSVMERSGGYNLLGDNQSFNDRNNGLPNMDKW